MKIQEYVNLTERTCVKLDTPLLDNLHMCLGMTTEIGELLDVFKKHMAYGKPIDWINVKEEIGDQMFYIACFCRINGFDLEAIMENNIKKLMTRYPNKFTQEDAINRNLSAERKVLEELSK
jgi:NTP pyrophosphatase (non-canonical NTP hydrolase)